MFGLVAISWPDLNLDIQGIKMCDVPWDWSHLVSCQNRLVIYLPPRQQRNIVQQFARSHPIAAGSAAAAPRAPTCPRRVLRGCRRTQWKVLANDYYEFRVVAIKGNDVKIPKDKLSKIKLFPPISPCPTLKQDPLTALSSLTATTPSLDFSTSMHWCAYSPAFSWCQTFRWMHIVFTKFCLVEICFQTQ